MPARVVVGVQWGDEGKGKIIDILASRADVVVRSQGGNNAGHTVENGGEVYKLQLIPSGILYPYNRDQFLFVSCRSRPCRAFSRSDRRSPDATA